MRLLLNTQTSPATPSFLAIDIASGIPSGIHSRKINPTGEARQAEAEQSGRRGGKLSNLIYGTPEGQQMDQEMERSFSQLLARGKYVHSIVFHDVKPDKVDEYVETVGKWYPRMASLPDNKVNLVGSWRTEVGDCDTFGLRDNRPTFEVGLMVCSSHLGIPTIPGLSPIASQHPISS